MPAARAGMQHLHPFQILSAIFYYYFEDPKLVEAESKNKIKKMNRTKQKSPLVLSCDGLVQ